MEGNRKVDRKLVDHICEIAKLELEEGEVESYIKDLNGVLEIFKKMDEVDTANVEPSFQPYRVENIWREDEVIRTDWDPLGNARHKEKRFFKGPKII